MGGTLFNVITMVINAAQRGSGNTKLSMITNLTSSVVNVFFNYLLIEGHLGFPRLEVAGDAIATAVTLMDGLVVIGGGIMNNADYLMPGILRTMRGKMRLLSGETLDRVQMKVYNLDDPDEFRQFAAGEARRLKVYGSDREVIYDPQKRIGIMRSKIGASKAISLGAYAFALAELDK